LTEKWFQAHKEYELCKISWIFGWKGVIIDKEKNIVSKSGDEKNVICKSEENSIKLYIKIG
jgi:hypothetical protein